MGSRQEIVNFIDKSFQGIGNSLNPLELPSSIIHSKDTKDRKVESDRFGSYFEHSSYHTREFNVKDHDVLPSQHHHLHTDKPANELISFTNKHQVDSKASTRCVGLIDGTGATGNAGATGNSEPTGVPRHIGTPLRHEKAIKTAYHSDVGELKEVSDGVKHLCEKKRKQRQGQYVKGEKREGRWEDDNGGEGSEGQDEDSKDYVHVIYAKSSEYCNRDIVEVAKVEDGLASAIAIRESSSRSSLPTDATLSEEEKPAYEDDFIIIEHEK
ncbi:hypothetical protein DFP73DRAFT_125708 [Morchella snyderi]|nr:hypothetical protein DFP73DRAFT_125708 [Morchella snyderi]